MSRMSRVSLRPAAARFLAAGALAVGFAAPATANAGILDSVQGWWPMYEGSGQTIHDLSGKGNNGMLGSTPGADTNDPTWIKGILFGSALRFDGNDFVRIPTSGNELAPKNLTVSAWIRGTSGGQYNYIVSKGANGCLTSSYAIYTDYWGKLRFYIQDANGVTRLSGGADPAAVFNGKWHHVAGTYDGTTAKLFVDGKLLPLADTDPVPPAGPGSIDYGTPTTGDAGLGNYLGTCDLFYTGDIDDVAVFSQALPIDKYWAALALLFPKPLR
jgi:hypothetical protein